MRENIPRIDQNWATQDAFVFERHRAKMVRPLVYLPCLFMLEFFCFVNSFIFDLKGASIDAGRFQDYAIEWVQSGRLEFVVDAAFYIQFLGVIYKFFGPNEFLGAQFGVISLFVAAIYFEKILLLFDVRRSYLWVIPFLLWPSLLPRATTTMREPYLIMFLVLISYNMMLFELHKDPRKAINALVLALVSAFFHKAFAVLLIFLLPYIIFVKMSSRLVFYRSKIFYVRVVIIVMLMLLIVKIVSDFSDVRGLQPFLALTSVDTEYMESVLASKSSKDFRTTYDVILNFTSPLSFLISFFQVFIYYEFSPFPWMARTGYDIYASLEGVFRFVGFVVLFNIWKNQKKPQYNINTIIFLLFIISAIWASGTVNYGTASRHHTTTNWIFLIAYAVGSAQATWPRIHFSKRVIKIGRND